MCICLKSGLWGCPNYFRVKAGYTLDEKPSALSRTVKSCHVWFGLWEETREPSQSWDLPKRSHLSKLVATYIGLRKFVFW